jgi:hypothetical protein
MVRAYALENSWECMYNFIACQHFALDKLALEDRSYLSRAIK